MSEMKCETQKYRIGNNILIGRREDGSLFWLKIEDEKIRFAAEGYEVTAVEGGKVIHDKGADTTILDYPTKDRDILSSIQNEYFESCDEISNYADTAYLIELSGCELHEVTKNDCSEYEAYMKDNQHKLCHDENIGYVLDDVTFINVDQETGDLSYLQFSDFTDKACREDRFCWVEPHKRIIPEATDEEIFEQLKIGFVQETYGKAWIDKENNVLVLGPAHDIRPEIIDNYFHDRLWEHYKVLPIWDRSKYWISAESKLERTDVFWKMNFLSMQYKYEG